jgi:hypothetical protein
MQSLTSEFAQQDADIDRCRREIAAIEAQILAGHPDLEGLCLALSDWSGELRLLQGANVAAELAQFAPVCARFAKGGPVVRPGHGPRNVGPLGRNTGVLRRFRLQCRDGGFSLRSRQMSADVLR